MIKIELDIPMPKACIGCFLLDDEFEYCHGHLVNDCTELRSYLRTNPYTKPDWCPLIDESICKYYLTNGTCAGTRENDPCPCEGNESLCKLRSIYDKYSNRIR